MVELRSGRRVETEEIASVSGARVDTSRGGTPEQLEAPAPPVLPPPRIREFRNPTKRPHDPLQDAAAMLLGQSRKGRFPQFLWFLRDFLGIWGPCEAASGGAALRSGIWGPFGGHGWRRGGRRPSVRAEGVTTCGASAGCARVARGPCAGPPAEVDWRRWRRVPCKTFMEIELHQARAYDEGLPYVCHVCGLPTGSGNATLG
ncbi:hypothetical protein Taro_038742 [Colocasia esculenta]|uniref:Uncharacterized protein n=1 Tax=Colocasia esculenta TaxID=4460 RepID=A0A843WDP7_COLES|nr:hypothetical protein [Colocasia esculenta]